MPKQEGVMIQSVERALSLLGRIADHPEQKYSLTELTEFLGIDKSSVFRLLSTLMKYGLVRQEEGKKGYQLGFGIYSLAAALRDQLKLTELASPALKRLALSTKENAHLAVRSGARAVFIDRERATKTIAANTSIGDSEDLHCTAVGKCLICGLSRSELERLFEDSPLARYTERTICDLDGLAEELATVRERGYALDWEENERHVVCMAAPIYNFERGVEASIGVSGPRDRMEAQLEVFAAEVLATGRELSVLLGGAKPTS
ncbi:MAG: IclR family transcriptional regulator [Rectinemataceae bacterium]|jgi:DNA-binding IclR family transcriptional regulator